MNIRHTSRTILIASLLCACSTHDDHESHHHDDSQSWSVTAWGEQFEIFAETDLLEVARPATAFTHVTDLDDFSPLDQGTVSLILIDASGGELRFAAEEPTRSGIFSIEVLPESAGEFEIHFQIESSAGEESIPAGRVSVGETGTPSGLLASAPTAATAAEASSGTEIPFLKEQQWRVDFATAWVEEGSLHEAVRGPGRVRVAAGGEVVLTSPVDGTVTGEPWPHSGRGIERGSVVFQVTQRVASGRSLAELEAEASGLEAELEAATLRLQRLEELLDLGATSAKEIEEARARKATLESRVSAARRDLATVHSGRGGAGEPAETLPVIAPFTGRIARVDVTPGQAIGAATPLGLLVRESPLWIEVSLRPEVAAQVRKPAGLELELSGGSRRLWFEADRARLVSLSPTVDPQTATIQALFEIDSNVDELPIGSPVDVAVQLPDEQVGIVVPETALVDDSGVTVVYLQIGGESFSRSEVQVRTRQGGMVLIDGLSSGGRVVELGGNAIRRAALVASDVGDGHMH